MVKYDPKILQKYAEVLYSNARSIVFMATAIGAILGVAPGFIVGNAISKALIPPEYHSIVVTLLAVVVIFVFGWIGHAGGQGIAFWYRLKAQLTLCQKQIEYNTRANPVQQQSSSFEEIIP